MFTDPQKITAINNLIVKKQKEKWNLYNALSNGIEGNNIKERYEELDKLIRSYEYPTKPRMEKVKESVLNN